MAELRRATIDDLELVARIVAEAFADDPVFRWVLDDDATRPAKLAVIFGGLTRDTLPDRGVVDLVDAASVALWRDPTFDHHAEAGTDDADGTDAGTTDTGTTDAGPGPFTDAELGRLGELERVMHEAHPTEQHWYLNVLATLPSQRDRGLGSAAMRPVLAEADAAALPCYLVSTNPRNRPLYRRHGFEDRDELSWPGPSMLPMWRPPGA